MEINEMRFELDDSEIYRVSDSDRLIFLIPLSDIENLNVDFWVNKLMDWVTYDQPSIENGLTVDYQNVQ